MLILKCKSDKVKHAVLKCCVIEETHDKWHNESFNYLLIFG